MKTLAFSFAGFITLLTAIMLIVAINGDPLGGEPFAVIEVDPADRPSAQVESSVTKDVAPTRVPPIEQGSRISEDGGNRDMAALTGPGGQMPANDGPLAQSNIAMASVPVAALVEDTRYGPLPRIAEDGRQPSDIYARPTPYKTLPQAGEPVRIAIMVNGLGLSELATNQAINMLPGSITLAFSPYGRNLQSWVRLSRQAGHEVMLQVPLEPFDYPDNDPGPHTLLTNLPPEENLNRLQWLMSRFTGYVGITNHMGAKFASAQSAFLPVLEELKTRGLIFLDDGTASRSTAGEIAKDLGLGFSVAQFVIDAAQTPEGIDDALQNLEAAARENGLAIGVASSYPITIQRISEWSRSLSQKGIVLVPISAAVRARAQS